MITKIAVNPFEVEAVAEVHMGDGARTYFKCRVRIAIRSFCSWYACWATRNRVVEALKSYYNQNDLL